MILNAETLPENVDELKSILLDLEQRYLFRIEFLEERIRLLTKELFGPKSEKRPQESELRQLQLFNEAEAVVAEEKKEEPTLVPAHTRQKPKRKPLPGDLPRVDEIHDIPEEKKICDCGAVKSCIGQEVSEKLDIIPAKMQVIRLVRLKYACKNCEGVESEEPTVQIAPAPPQIIPKGIATPGLLAHIAVSKYCDALPLYRQEKIFSRYGIEISRSTMSSWMVMVADHSKLLMDLIQRELVSGLLVNADETPVQVLKEPGRKNTTKSYMWVFRGGNPEKPVILFWYSQTRSGDVPKEVLEGFHGYLQTDDFSAYEALAGQTCRVGCFAHTRRNFVKVIEARGAEAKKKTGSAEVALEYIGRLYKIERFARDAELSPDEIQKLRMEKAEPILKEFKAWMEERIRLTPPKGLLGKALNHALSNWPMLIRYLEDGNIPIDNNAAENAIRPFVIGRKNWLFAGHPNGAHAAATLYSLIETAKSCGLEPYQYLRYIFEKIPYAQTEDDYRALLPQNLTPEQLTRSSP
jgi:transposase